MSGRVLLVVAAAALLTVPAATTAVPADSAVRPLAVLAFQESSDAPALIDRSAAALTTVGVDGINLTNDGADVSEVSADARRQLARAHHDGLRAELLVGNFSARIDDFSEPAAYGLLAHPARIARVADEVGAIVRHQSWDGLSIDLESMAARDAAGYVAFLRALRSRLPAGATLAVDVQNNTSLADYRDNGYRLATIASLVDRVELMAYDEHGPWEDEPGPVASRAWVMRGLDVLLRRVPRGKVDLGVAGYGYAWRPHSNDTLSDAQARALAGSRAAWRPDVGEWTARLRDGSTLWWSDARTYRARAALARTYHLHGVAVWSLGHSDRIRR